MFTDRLLMLIRTGDGSLRGVSLLFGINLILAGLIIFWFPEILVFAVSFALIAGGFAVIFAGWRRSKRPHETQQLSFWEQQG